MSILSDARKLRAAMVTAAPALDDATASTAPGMFPRLKGDGSLIRAGTRINWYGIVKRAAVDLWDAEGNNPDNAPNLWADLNYRNGYRIIPSVIAVTEAFSEGEKGWWEDGVLYRSRVDGNVYTPAQYRDNWEALSV